MPSDRGISDYLVSCVSLLFVLGRRLSSVIPVTDGSIVPAIMVSQRFMALATITWIR